MAAPAADSVTVVSAEGERFSVPRRVRPRAARRAAAPAPAHAPAHVSALARRSAGSCARAR
jgi:hypothetical protein